MLLAQDISQTHKNGAESDNVSITKQSYPHIHVGI